MDIDRETFMPGRSKLSAGESLAPDLSAYETLHTLSAQWPCLSCDIVRDNLGDDRRSYPATVYAVAGTQAAQGRERENQLMVMKLSGLSKNDHMEEDSDEEEDDDNEDTEPILETKSIPLQSCTNRIRAWQSPQATSAQPPTTLAASWTDSHGVLIYDVTPHLNSLDTPGASITPSQNKPLCTIRSHGKKVEGFALDWSPVEGQCKLLSGDTEGKIFLTTRTQGGGFVTDTTPYAGHIGTVEEIQWSPVSKEPTVFASAGNDGRVCIYDTRLKRAPVITMQCSQTDLNVLSWNRVTQNLLATGAEDGQWCVWDMRKWKPNTNGSVAGQGSPIASFDFHKEQITSLEWHPTDDSIVAVCAGDNTVTLWDLAVELDDEESRYTADVRDVPPQLLFCHWNPEVKEAHWVSFPPYE